MSITLCAIIADNISELALEWLAASAKLDGQDSSRVYLMPIRDGKDDDVSETETCNMSLTEKSWYGCGTIGPFIRVPEVALRRKTII